MTVISKHHAGTKQQRRCARIIKELRQHTEWQPELAECLRLVHPLDLRTLETLRADAEEAWDEGKDLNPRRYDWSLEALEIKP